MHVAGADLDDISVVGDEIDCLSVDSFGDDEQAIFLADFGENLEPLYPQSLKAVG